MERRQRRVCRAISTGMSAGSAWDICPREMPCSSVRHNASQTPYVAAVVERMDRAGGGSQVILEDRNYVMLETHRKK